MSNIKPPLVEKALSNIRETLYKNRKQQKMVDINEATRKRERNGELRSKRRNRR